MKPRSLLKNEIEEILDSAIPLDENLIFIQKDGVAKRRMIENIRRDLREQLRSVQLVPEQKNALVQSIRDKLLKSLSQPGYPVGMSVAESFGQEVSQAVLNSKRTTGAGQDFSGGLSAVEAVLTGSKGSNFPANIYFTNKYFTVFDIYRMASQFTYMTLQSISLKGQTELLRMEEYNEEWWVSVYKQIHGEIPFGKSAQHVIKVYLDMNVIYKHQVSVSSIIQAISSLSMGSYLYPVPSPLTIEKPCIDIFLNSLEIENYIEKETKGNVKGAVEIFYSNVFLTTDIHIKGIGHLLQMVPRSVPVKEAILLCTPVVFSEIEVKEIMKEGGNKSMTENVWRIKLNRFFMNKHGIPKEKVISLLEACGIVDLSSDDLSSSNEGNDEYDLLVKTQGGSPDKILAEKISKAVQDQDKVFKDTIVNINVKGKEKVKLNEIYKLSQHFYSLVKVEKVKDKRFDILWPLSRYKIVDSTHSYAGDMYENLDVLGVIGMKNYLDVQIASLISGVGGNPIYIHVDIMTKYMTRLGNMTRFNLKGVEKESGGIATALLWREQFRLIGSGSAQGVVSSKDSLAGMKFLNAQTRMGSHISDVLEDKILEKAYLDIKEGKSVQEIMSELEKGEKPEVMKGVQSLPSFKAPQPVNKAPSASVKKSVAPKVGSKSQAQKAPSTSVKSQAPKKTEPVASRKSQAQKAPSTSSQGKKTLPTKKKQEINIDEL